MELVDNPASPGHPRLTIAAAALAVLAVLVIPPVVIGLVDLAAPVAPVERFPTFSLTDRARQVAELPGANVLADSVVLTLTPEMNAPVMQPSQIVLPDESTGQLVPLGVSGLLPMTPDLAPAGTGGLMSGLVPGDKVFANLGPLVASCLVGPGDTAGSCTPTLLTQHSTGYYRYPGAWGTATFLDDGSPMQADLLDVLGSRLVAGGLPGTERRQDRRGARRRLGGHRLHHRVGLTRRHDLVGLGAAPAAAGQGVRRGRPRDRRRRPVPVRGGSAAIRQASGSPAPRPSHQASRAAVTCSSDIGPWSIRSSSRCR